MPRRPGTPEPSRPPPPSADDLAGLLPPEVELPTGVELRRDAPAEEVTSVWYGVVWGRLGRGDLAWGWFDRVRVPALGAWLAGERGRLLRELGGHGAAEQLELAALPAAVDPIDAALLGVSLAADAVGRADAGLARQRLTGAQRLLAELPDSPRRDRQLLRAGWVEVEVALLTGAAPPTHLLPRLRGDGELELPAPHRSGSRFHTAKGCLFAGVVRREPELLERAAGLAPPALLWAVHLARASLGAPGAEAAATAARQLVVPPPGYREVADGPPRRPPAPAVESGPDGDPFPRPS